MAKPITASSKALKMRGYDVDAASGSVDVILNDGKNKTIFALNRPSNGLLVAPMLWREIKNFSGGGICLVLASLPYDEKDYFRNFDEFMKVKWKI